jgi:hypothetical protein
MPARIDRTGQIFGRLTALKRTGTASNHQALWLFRCECGGEITRRMCDVVSGRTRSCGCLLRESSRSRFTTHGHSVGKSRTRTFGAWLEMKRRCYNSNTKQWHNYGGRGISVCDEWRGSFETFLRDMGECPEGLSLDRIDVNGDYRPGNCRWITTKEQCRNQRKTVLIDHEGRQVSLAEFAEIVGLNYFNLHWKIRRLGLSSKEAVASLREAQSKRPTTRQPRSPPIGSA